MSSERFYDDMGEATVGDYADSPQQRLERILRADFSLTLEVAAAVGCGGGLDAIMRSYKEGGYLVIDRVTAPSLAAVLSALGSTDEARKLERELRAKRPEIWEDR